MNLQRKSEYYEESNLFITVLVYDYKRYYCFYLCDLWREEGLL